MKNSINKKVKLVLELEKKIHQSWVNYSIQKKKYGISGGDGIKFWYHKKLFWFDKFPAILYAFGVPFNLIVSNFPQIFITDSFRKIFNGIDMSRYYYNESYNYSILDQLNFIKKNKLRNPRKILEIGGGRGEVANSFFYMGTDCVSIEPGQYAEFLYEVTGEYFFGENFISNVPLNISLSQYSNSINLSIFDTIIFCETIEHIPEDEFWNFWGKVCSDFEGLFIITNIVDYHPIPITFPEHIFEINDKIYDKLSIDSKRCIFRKGSHLVLEF